MATTTIQPPLKSTSSRLLSLDVVRGLTIALMILVNDPGNNYAYRPLQHSDWSGWTPTDLVFPSFLFVAGVALVFSTEARRARGASNPTLLLHALRRAVILFLLGLVVNGFPFFPLATLRINGVLQRIAICYFLAAIVYLWNQRAAWIASWAVAALAGYWVLMRWVAVPGYGVPTHGFPLLDKDINLVAWLDRRIFPGRLYEGTRDPEGLLSNIPAMATILIGVLTGLWLRTKHLPKRKLTGLAMAAFCGLIAGEVWNIWFPINKKLWTSSYVLFAAGCTLIVLAACYWLIEIKEWRRGWTLPWIIFGSNAITAYVFSELLDSTLFAIRVHLAGHVVTLHQALYARLFAWIGDPSLGSLAYSLAYVAVCLLPIAILYRKKIFIRI